MEGMETKVTARRGPLTPHDGLPRLVVSYGMVKTGSTFAFELSKKLLLQHGLEQPRLSDSAMAPGHKINFATNWNRQHVDAMCQEAASYGTTVVVKTHAKPRPAIRSALEQGTAVGHAVFRDPRDLALSLVDAGSKSRSKGHKAFSNIYTVDDAMIDIDAHLENFLSWVDVPQIRPVDFQSLTTNPEVLADVLSAQLGLKFDCPPAVRDVLENEFIQFNKGVQHRHRSEMSDDDSDRFLEHYSDFYDAFF